jgi:hypothetical protein
MQSTHLLFGIPLFLFIPSYVIFEIKLHHIHIFSAINILNRLTEKTRNLNLKYTIDRSMVKSKPILPYPGLF